MTLTHKYRAIILSGFLIGLLGCAPKMVNTLTSSNYDKKKNLTNYSVLPYGSVSLPGEWIAGQYFKPAHQQYFRRKDSVLISISLGPGNKLPFSKEGLKGFAFAKAYYEWESKYQSDTLKQNIRLIESDSVNKYVIAKIFSDSVHMMALYAAKDCACKEGAFQHFTISTRKMNDEEQVKFLRDIYLRKND